MACDPFARLRVAGKSCAYNKDELIEYPLPARVVLTISDMPMTFNSTSNLSPSDETRGTILPGSACTGFFGIGWEFE